MERRWCEAGRDHKEATGFVRGAALVDYHMLRQLSGFSML
jgi:hypothetical protein